VLVSSYSGLLTGAMLIYSIVGMGPRTVNAHYNNGMANRLFLILTAMANAERRSGESQK
jgi:hypothetical protein